MRIGRRGWLALLAVLGLGAAVHGSMLLRHAPAAATDPPPSPWRITETAHYRIASLATPEQTARTGEAMERLRAGFLHTFGDLPAANAPHPKLRLTLYATRGQFKAQNRSIPWAEALYRAGECRAYIAEGANPFHWMSHEATHQLAREVMRFHKAKWIDEGLASYFGASRMDARGLYPGTLDFNAYPLWWLSQFHFTGNLESDARTGRIIPLRQLIEDTGPPIASHVNLYYIEYWSLTHFLLHFEQGRYAAGYKRLLQHGASLEDFEREIGPVLSVQVDWYAWLREQQAKAWVVQAD